MFVEKIKKRLGIRSKGCEILEDGNDYQLRDGQTRYGAGTHNLHHWNPKLKPAGPYIA